MKGYSKKISDVYVIPLPFYVKALPPLVLHNPVSVIMYLWAVFKHNPVQPCHSGVVVRHCHNAAAGVRVSDPESMMQLWQQGFFGKGTLSRSEPSWFGRTARRLGLDGGELTLEEVTEMRRAKRRQFKRDREIQQQQELLEKKRREGVEVDHAIVARSHNIEEEKEAVQLAIREEDTALVCGDTIERLEYLQLMPCEAVFLVLGLGVLAIPGSSTSDLLSELLPSPQIWREYIVYHYFRSLGWCVRDGVKFGSHYLLYRKGPPFQHAEFAVMVMDPQEPRPWWWVHANMRVLGGAKKTLTLVYVQPAAVETAEMPDWKQVHNVNDFRRELMKYTVKPVTLSRFAPAKNRD